jgi:hypothetical protein
LQEHGLLDLHNLKRNKRALVQDLCLEDVAFSESGIREVDRHAVSDALKKLTGDEPPRVQTKEEINEQFRKGPWYAVEDEEGENERTDE